MQSSSCLCKSSWAPKASENGVGRKQLKVDGATETPNWLQQSMSIVFWLWGAWRRWKWSWRGWGLGKLEKMSSRPETGLSCIDQSCWRPVDMVVMVVGKPKFSEEYNCGAWTAIFSRPVGEMNKSRRPKRPPQFPSHISWTINTKPKLKRNGVGLKLEGSCYCYIRKDAWPFLSLSLNSLYPPSLYWHNLCLVCCCFGFWFNWKRPLWKKETRGWFIYIEGKRTNLLNIFIRMNKCEFLIN